MKHLSSCNKHISSYKDSHVINTLIFTEVEYEGLKPATNVGLVPILEASS